MNIADTVLFSFIAALLSMDQMACFQILLSRPVVAAAILGVVFGDPTEAVLVGICFEFLFCRAIPLKERPADPMLATAAVLGGMWSLSPDIYGHAVASIPPMAAAPFAGAIGLAASFLSKWVDLRMRDVNTALYHRIHRVGYVQLTAAAALFAKSFGFYLLTVLAVQGSLPRILVLLGPAAVPAAVFAWVVMLSICLAYTTSVFFHSSTGLLWAAGLVIGVLVLVLARLYGVPASAACFIMVSLCAAFLAVEAFRGRREAPSV